MNRTELLNQLAAAVHAIWVNDHVEEGWRHGPYDPERRTHDALVPFDHLSRGDRKHARDAVAAEEADRWLPRLLRYERGPSREFLIEEMREGLAVGLAEGDPSERGRVVGWTRDDEGELEEIQVRWSDGTITQHHPAARELRRVET